MKLEIDALDELGLAHLLEKINAALSTKQPALRPDASLHLTEDGEISVSLPVVALSAAEYEALTEEERQAEALYAVEEPAWTPLPQGLSLQEYDTEDGWHVRKWSDGYVELTMDIPVQISRWSVVNGISYFSSTVDHALPFRLVKKATEVWGAVDAANGMTFPIGVNSYRWNQYDPLSYTMRTCIMTFGDSPGTGTIVTCVRITGRWK